MARTGRGWWEGSRINCEHFVNTINQVVYSRGYNRGIDGFRSQKFNKSRCTYPGERMVELYFPFFIERNFFIYEIQ